MEKKFRVYAIKNGIVDTYREVLASSKEEAINKSFTEEEYLETGYPSIYMDIEAVERSDKDDMWFQRLWGRREKSFADLEGSSEKLPRGRSGKGYVAVHRQVRFLQWIAGNVRARSPDRRWIRRIYSK